MLPCSAARGCRVSATRSHQRTELERRAHRFLLEIFQPGELEEIGDHPVERVGPFPRQLEVVLLLFRGVGHAGFDRLERAAQGEERGAQVVHDRADELLALLFQLRLVLQRFLQLDRHPLEGGIELTHLAHP